MAVFNGTLLIGGREVPIQDWVGSQNHEIRVNLPDGDVRQGVVEHDVMGSIGKVEQVVCKARIYAVSPLQQVEIIKDGQIIWQQAVKGLDADVNWIDPERPVKEHYYYLHVIQEDGHQAWASPIWIGPLPEVSHDPNSS